MVEGYNHKSWIVESVSAPRIMHHTSNLWQLNYIAALNRASTRTKLVVMECILIFYNYNYTLLSTLIILLYIRTVAITHMKYILPGSNPSLLLSSNKTFITAKFCSSGR